MKFILVVLLSLSAASCASRNAGWADISRGVGVVLNESTERAVK